MIRHARAAPTGAGWITSAEMGVWIAAYNSSPLALNSPPPDELTEIAQSSGGVVCSSLRRSFESAQLLGADNIILQSSLLIEAGLPYANSGSIKLPASVWAVLFRAAWMFGYSRNSESRVQARLRAKDAAAQLTNLADTHTHIVYIGHGIFNRMVASALLSDGWQGPQAPSSRHWGQAVYVSP